MKGTYLNWWINSFKDFRDKGIFTAKKMKFSIKNFFSKTEEIFRKLRIWSHLLKKSSMENFIFCAVFYGSNVIHTKRLCFCFSSLNQDELSKINKEWNRHKLRPVRNSECPADRPADCVILNMKIIN